MKILFPAVLPFLLAVLPVFQPLGSSARADVSTNIPGMSAPAAKAPAAAPAAPDPSPDEALKAAAKAIKALKDYGDDHLPSFVKTVCAGKPASLDAQYSPQSGFALLSFTCVADAKQKATLLLGYGGEAEGWKPLDMFVPIGLEPKASTKK